MFFLTNFPRQAQAETTLVRMCPLIEVAPAPNCLCFTRRQSAVVPCRWRTYKSHGFPASSLLLQLSVVQKHQDRPAFPASQAFLLPFNVTPGPISALLCLILCLFILNTPLCCPQHGAAAQSCLLSLHSNQHLLSHGQHPRLDPGSEFQGAEKSDKCPFLSSAAAVIAASLLSPLTAEIPSNHLCLLLG